MLGRLSPHALLGGTFPIDARAAAKALASIADVTNGDVTAAAGAVVAIVDADMAKVLRIVSVERGHDPRTFALVAFGGGGPLHACGVASDIGVPRIVVPLLPGLFSAYGLLAADVRVSTTRSFVAVANDAAWRDVTAIGDALQAEGERALATQGISPKARAFVREVDLRYGGQSFELVVPFGSRETSIEAFHAAHERRYGYAARDEPVEIVTVRATAVGATPKPRLEAAPRAADARIPESARLAFRDVWDGTRLRSTPIYDRDGLPIGCAFDGPAVVEQYDTTTYVAPEWHASVDAYANLVLESLA